MDKADGAFLTISELANELDLPQHILRYWESRFPELKPLQRSGNRRYYRPADVALARRIHHLLNVEGFTVKGARKALSNGAASSDNAAVQAQGEIPAKTAASPSALRGNGKAADSLLSDLENISMRLARALDRSQ